MNLERISTVLLLCVGILISQLAKGQNSSDTQNGPTLKEILKKNGYPLRIEGKQLTGEGGIWLQKQAAKATITTIGEMHGTKEIPAAVTALVRHLKKVDEIDHLALEVSPWTVEQMTAPLLEGEQAYNEFISQYPTAVPFYNFKNERDLLLEVVRNNPVRSPIFGTDQIFAFATPLVFDRLQELASSAAARSAVRNVHQAGKTKTADDPRLQKLPAGIPVPISVFDTASFDTLHSYFDGIGEAQQILDELTTSIRIYRQNDSKNYASNQMRARYLRDNLRSSLNSVQQNSDQVPQVVIKIGARHAFRGMTPNNALDVGNLSVSLANSMGGEAFNVAILCGPGSKIRSFPNRVADGTVEYLKKSFYPLVQNKPMLFDLSKIHPILHDGVLKPGKEVEDFLWGFDAVVIIPSTTPAEYISFPTGK